MTSEPEETYTFECIEAIFRQNNKDLYDKIQRRPGENNGIILSDIHDVDLRFDKAHWYKLDPRREVLAIFRWKKIGS